MSGAAVAASRLTPSAAAGTPKDTLAYCLREVVRLWLAGGPASGAA